MSVAARSSAGTPLRVIGGLRAPLTVMLISGEASSDEHGAALVREILARVPDASVFGMGGSKLRAAGMHTVVDSEKSAAVMGFSELAGSIRKLLQARKLLLEQAEKQKPDVTVLIDFPDFNLILARSLKKMGCSVLYFITPQLWAWRRGRVKTIRRYVRKAAPIFPFEENFFQSNGVDAEYVGHPFLDRPPIQQSPSEFLRSHGLDPDRPVIALLPGSRKAEADFLLEPMLEAFKRLRATRPNLQAVIPVAPTLSLENFVERTSSHAGVTVIAGNAREVLAASRAAVVASGTATVEAALAEIPFVVVYRLASLSYFLARKLVTGVKYFAMPNLIAGKKVVPELLQSDVTGTKIARELEKILGDPAREAKMKKDVALIGERLRFGRFEGTTAAGRTAELVLELAEEKRGGAQSGWRNKAAARSVNS